MNTRSVKFTLNTEKQAIWRTLLKHLGAHRLARLTGLSVHYVLVAGLGRPLREREKQILERAIDAMQPILTLNFAESRDIAA